MGLFSACFFGERSHRKRRQGASATTDSFSDRLCINRATNPPRVPEVGSEDVVTKRPPLSHQGVSQKRSSLTGGDEGSCGHANEATTKRSPVSGIGGQRPSLSTGGNELRHAMIMDTSPAMITIVNQAGVVLHQNARSVVYYGDRVATRTWRGAESLYALLFAYEPAKGERMLKELAMPGFTGVWKAVVRVPCTLSLRHLKPPVLEAAEEAATPGTCLMQADDEEEEDNDADHRPGDVLHTRLSSRVTPAPDEVASASASTSMAVAAAAAANRSTRPMMESAEAAWLYSTGGGPTVKAAAPGDTGAVLGAAAGCDGRPVLSSAGHAPGQDSCSTVLFSTANAAILAAGNDSPASRQSVDRSGGGAVASGNGGGGGGGGGGSGGKTYRALATMGQSLGQRTRSSLHRSNLCPAGTVVTHGSPAGTVVTHGSLSVFQVEPSNAYLAPTVEDPLATSTFATLATGRLSQQSTATQTSLHQALSETPSGAAPPGTSSPHATRKRTGTGTGMCTGMLPPSVVAALGNVAADPGGAQSNGAGRRIPRRTHSCYIASTSRDPPPMSAGGGSGSIPAFNVPAVVASTPRPLVSTSGSRALAFAMSLGTSPIGPINSPRGSTPRSFKTASGIVASPSAATGSAFGFGSASGVDPYAVGGLTSVFARSSLGRSQYGHGRPWMLGTEASDPYVRDSLDCGPGHLPYAVAGAASPLRGDTALAAAAGMSTAQRSASKFIKSPSSSVILDAASAVGSVDSDRGGPGGKLQGLMEKLASGQGEADVRVSRDAGQALSGPQPRAPQAAYAVPAAGAGSTGGSAGRSYAGDVFSAAGLCPGVGAGMGSGSGAAGGRDPVLVLSGGTGPGALRLPRLGLSEPRTPESDPGFGHRSARSPCAAVHDSSNAQPQAGVPPSLSAQRGNAGARLGGWPKSRPGSMTGADQRLRRMPSPLWEVATPRHTEHSERHLRRYFSANRASSAVSLPVSVQHGPSVVAEASESCEHAETHATLAEQAKLQAEVRIEGFGAHTASDPATLPGTVDRESQQRHVQQSSFDTTRAIDGAVVAGVDEGEGAFAFGAGSDALTGGWGRSMSSALQAVGSRPQNLPSRRGIRLHDIVDMQDKGGRPAAGPTMSRSYLAGLPWADLPPAELPPTTATATITATVGTGISKPVRITPPSTPIREAECWHEVWATASQDPVTGADVIVLTQIDVTAKVVAERHLALVMETEHRLVEQLFPRHILQYITEEWTARQATGVAPLAGSPAASGGGPRGTCPLEDGEGGVWRPVIRDCNALATCHPEVTLLFADIRGFTPMCKDLEPRQVMALLNALYSRYDSMLDEYGVYKVETIGDCYFVAGGLIREDADGMSAVREGGGNEDPLHADRVFAFAKAMLSAAAQVVMPTTGQPVEIRVGLHTGPVVSGVVGTRMPRFCLFGDTVNTASRMESTGMPGAIHASEATFRRLSGINTLGWHPTGGIEVKGKGLMQTYLWRPDGPLNESPRAASAPATPFQTAAASPASVLPPVLALTPLPVGDASPEPTLGPEADPAWPEPEPGAWVISGSTSRAASGNGSERTTGTRSARVLSSTFYPPVTARLPALPSGHALCVGEALDGGGSGVPLAVARESGTQAGRTARKRSSFGGFNAALAVCRSP